MRQAAPRTLVLCILLLLAWRGGAEDFWIVQKLHEQAGTAADKGLLIAEPLAGGEATMAACRIVRQGDEQWIVGMLSVDLSGDYRLRLKRDGDAAPLTLVEQRTLRHRYYDVVLLIDTSLSMHKNDPANLRGDAIRSFVKLARRGGGIRRLALLAFDDEVRTLLPPTAPGRIGDLEPIMAELRPRGRTDFDKPFRAARELLAEGSGATPAVIFLSDGEPFGTYGGGHRLLAEMGCPIYAIGLSGEADAALLAKVAAENEGRFFDAPRADQLPGIFTEIFRLISPPATVYRETLTVDAEAGQSLLIDPDMRNTVLEWASLGGGQTVTLGDRELLAVADGERIGMDLAELTVGSHPLRVRGSGRASMTLLADADVDLLPIALNQVAEQGLPLATGVVLRGHALCDAVTIDAVVTTPGGRTMPLTVTESGVPGFHLFSDSPAIQAGTYAIRVRVEGRIGGFPFVRATTIHLQRHQRATAMQPLLSPTSGLSLPALDLPAPAAIELDPTRQATGTSDLRTTFWASAERLLLDDLYPGSSTTQELEVMLSSPAETEVEVRLASPEGNGVTIQVEGRVQANRKALLRISAEAGADAAGNRHEGTLVVTAGRQSWTVPIAVSVAVPRIVIEAAEPQFTDMPSRVTAVQKLAVRLEPGGRMPLRIETDLPALRVTPELLDGGVGAVRASLAFTVNRPVEQRHWQGTVRVSGIGLQPAELPWEVEIRERTAVPGIDQVRSGSFDWRLLLWILLALVIIALVLAAMRGNSRAVFVLASLAIHLAILFLVLPRVEEEPEEAQAVTTIQMTSGGVVHEQEIASEVATYRPDEQTPRAEAPQQVETAELPKPEEEQPSQLDTPEAQAVLEETAEAAEIVKEVPREELAPALAEPTTAVPAARREEIATPQDAPAAPAESAQPRESVAHLETATPGALAPAELQAEVRAAVDLNPAELPVEREAVTPDAPGEPTQAPVARRLAVLPTVDAPLEGGTRGAPGRTVMQVTMGDTVEALAPGDVASEVAVEAVLAGAATEVARPTVALSTPAAVAAEPISRRSAAESATGTTRGPAAPAMAAPATSAARVESTTAGSLDPGTAREHIEASTVAKEWQPEVARTPASITAPMADAPGAATTRLRASSSGRGTAEAHAVGEGAPVVTVTSTPRMVARDLPIDRTGDATVAPRVTLNPSIEAMPAPSVHGELVPAYAELPREAAAAPGRGRSSAPVSGGSESPRALDAEGAKPAPLTPALPLAASPMPMSVDAPVANLLQGSALREPPSIGLRQSEEGGRAAGKWGRTLPLLRYDGDWDADKTAMINLAHQLERRTGSLLPIESRTIDLTHPELGATPFLFMTGHRDFRLTEAERNALRQYLEQGGYLWINDSTDLGDEQYDEAVRRELGAIFGKAAELRAIPMDHGLFAAPYDLRQGYKGYRVPPGDKYRQDYIEGLWLGDRLAVVYTRNDYGDGLEIDPHTHPLMPSLSDLSPAEMQEGSARMGINIALHFMNRGEAPKAHVTTRVQTTTSADDAEDRAWIGNPPLDSPLSTPSLQWVQPEGWGDLIPATGDYTEDGTLRLRFRKEGGTVTRRDKAVIGTALDIQLSNRQGIVLDLLSTLSGGARMALAFNGPDGYIESGPVFLRPGMNRDVAFDLSASSFKNEATQWEHTAEFGERRQVDAIYLIIYPQQGAGELRMEKIRLIQRSEGLK